ncbi:hypothetical protein L218DRAFT_251265 [Marasmius fiardii PR-910]|nr:hypothetical protein L218DRAFT_251265 [Marasmius fiardii PR-910]
MLNWPCSQKKGESSPTHPLERSCISATAPRSPLCHFYVPRHKELGNESVTKYILCTSILFKEGLHQLTFPSTSLQLPFHYVSFPVKIKRMRLTLVTFVSLLFLGVQAVSIQERPGSNSLPGEAEAVARSQNRYWRREAQAQAQNREAEAVARSQNRYWRRAAEAAPEALSWRKDAKRIRREAESY